MAIKINFNNYRDKLTNKDKEDILLLVTHRCRLTTYRKIKANLDYSLSLIPHLGILERIYKDEHGWQYCAGQSYPDEMRTIRQILKECK